MKPATLPALALALVAATAAQAEESCNQPVGNWKSREAVHAMASERGWTLKRIKNLFLNEQQKAGRHFHLFMDQPTLEAFEDFLRQSKSDVIKSLTEIADLNTTSKNRPPRLSSLPFPGGLVECPASSRSPFLLKAAFRLHRAFLKDQALPSLSTLGAPSDVSIQNSLLLLERAQALAEMDLREDN